LLEVDQAYLAEGEAGLLDRSSAPKSIPHRTSEELVEVIVLLRRLRMTGAEIAFCLAMALSTVSAVLLRVGLGKLSRLEPPEPPNRYERRHAGELLHIDVKKLAPIPDWGAGHRVHGNRRLQRNPTKTNAAGQRERQGRLGIRPRVRRRRDPHGLSRGPRRQEGDHSRRVPQARDRLLRPARHHRRARHDRRMKVKLPGRLAAPLRECGWVRVTDEAKRRFRG
jgi:hypothetical protein